jgi:phospho-N-acetylmuramoyl-pentapeptide-transferase
MLQLLTQFTSQSQLFNLFNYITFRTGGAMFTAMIMAFVIGAPFIAWLRTRQGKGQPIREDGPQGHLLTKKGTPTMGGLIILLSLGVTTLLWSDLKNPYVWAVLLVTMCFGAIGFVDDFAKVTKQHHGGLSARMRLFFEFVTAAVASIAMLVAEWVAKTPSGVHDVPHFLNALMSGAPLTAVALPFVIGWGIQLFAFYVLFMMVVIVGFRNAVNLTDGLDGLAIGTTLIAAAAFTVLTYVTGHAVFSRYLDLLFIPRIGEVTIFMGAMVGASMGFLWWNCYPAHIFMGDVGSLALGGALGTVAILTKQEVLFFSIGAMFVIEAFSVILQVLSFKLRGKRVFRMAPLHHHFELIGWKETQVVVRFWIVAFIFALLSLTTVKLR